MLPWYLTSQQQHHDNLQQEVYMTTLYSAANAIQATENCIQQIAKNYAIALW